VIRIIIGQKEIPTDRVPRVWIAVLPEIRFEIRMLPVHAVVQDSHDDLRSAGRHLPGFADSETFPLRGSCPPRVAQMPLFRED
jgi:hypothetical protein